LCHACPACRLHARTVKKLGKRLQELSADQDAARQELLIKAAELLDMQAQLKEADGRQQLQQDAASEQVRGSLAIAGHGMQAVRRWTAACTACQVLGPVLAC
jgi:Tfp pilus assembly protein FimV